VSRVHSLITFNEDKEIWVEDGGSKFGTLVLLSKPLRIDNAVCLQINRSYLNIYLKDKIIPVGASCNRMCKKTRISTDPLISTVYDEKLRTDYP
jgi:hypothetical protein